MSNNDGCVISRSNEVKDLGIPMGIPIYQIESLIKKHQIYTYSSNYTLYGDMSQRVMDTLKQFTPDIEVYSIDEAFLELTHLPISDYEFFGTNLIQTIYQWTGIPVSIGIGPTKTLAKIANHLAKKEPTYRGVCSLMNSNILDSVLSKLPAKDIWGIGSKLNYKLKAHGIHTAKDLKYINDSWAKNQMTIVGLRMIYELRGISCLALEKKRNPKNEIIVSRSFSKPINTLDEMKESVAFYVSRAAEKLRKEKSVANFISVYIRTNPFKEVPQYSNMKTIKLPVPTNLTNELIHYALIITEEIFKFGYSYKKSGVFLSELISDKNIQMNFFDQNNRIKSQSLMNAIDTINTNYGTHFIRYASMGISQTWKAKFYKKSPRYTTHWNEILKVHI